MIRTIQGGSSGFRILEFLGFTRMRRYITCNVDSPANGASPVTISYKMMPYAYESYRAVRWFPLNLFGRHVAGSAEKRSTLGHAHGAFGERSCQAKVGDINLIVFIYQDILGVQVAVNCVFSMRCGKST
jgi:hypothetical protein